MAPLSLWADYQKERLGYEAIEREFGFVVFKITGALCEIFDIYVRPEDRRGRKAWSLVDEVVETAKQQQCKTLAGYIWPAFPGAEGSLSAHLAYGFRVYSADGGKIIMAKDIGG